MHLVTGTNKWFICDTYNLFSLISLYFRTHSQRIAFNTPFKKTAVKAHLQVAGDGHCHNWMKHTLELSSLCSSYLSLIKILDWWLLWGRRGEQYLLELYLHVGRVVLAVLTPVCHHGFVFFPKLAFTLSASSTDPTYSYISFSNVSTSLAPTQPTGTSSIESSSITAVLIMLSIVASNSTIFSHLIPSLISTVHSFDNWSTSSAES